MRKFRLCFIPVLFFLISSPSVLKAHECGPKTLSVNVGQSKSWSIKNDEPQFTSTYTIKTLGDTSIVRISPVQPFSGNGDGDYTFTGKKAGQTKFVIEWKAVFNGITIGQDDCEVTVTVSAPQQQPDIDVKPTSIDFGKIRFGQTLKKTFQVFNKGNATLNVSDISSDDASFFAGPSSFSLAPGDSQLVEAVYDPAKLGSSDGTLTIVSNDPDESEVQISVSGEAGEPDIEVGPLPLPNPPAVVVGDSSKNNFRVSNKGTFDLVLTSITSSNPAFSVEFQSPFNTFPYTLPTFPPSPDNFEDFDIVFKPSKAGPDSTTITIVSDDPDESELVYTVKSVGLAPAPDIDAKPTSVLFFQRVRVGESAKMSFQVFNVGDATLNVNDITSNNNAFFASPKSFSIVPGDSQLVDVVFEPIACGDTLGTLTIVSNDPDEPQFLVEVGGGGLTPDIETLVSENPPPTIVGQQVAALGSVDVINVGCDNVMISAITSSNPAFPIEIGFPGPSLPLALPFSAPNNVLTIFVDFVPIQAGPDSTIITITSDDPDEPTVTVKVASMALAPPSVDLSFDRIDGTIQVGEINDIQLQLANPAGQGAADLEWSADISASQSSATTNFIELIVPTSGSISPGESDSVTIQLKGLLVADTTYMADIEISTNIPGEDSMLVIPVTLMVQDSNVTSIELSNAVPTTFSLSDNYPNPFNPTTTIEYQLPEASKVRLVIYNMLGQKVRTLVDEQNQPGVYKVTWDARNDFGSPVAGGLYIYYFTAGDFKKVQKMILLK